MASEYDQLMADATGLPVEEIERERQAVVPPVNPTWVYQLWKEGRLSMSGEMNTEQRKHLGELFPGWTAPQTQLVERCQCGHLEPLP